MAASLLQAKAIRKSYAGVKALKGISFELRPGEVHALIGENGAGKSTLVKIITGATKPDSGSLSICGSVIAENSPAAARALGIAAIYQQPSLFPDLSVAENIGLALESNAAWRTIDWKARKQRAAQLLKQAGGSIDANRSADSLSMAEQQIVEIAKAIGSSAKILIMDEPTASLTDSEVQSLFQVIREQAQRGVGIIYISHRLDEIASIANRVSVLRDGEMIATRDKGDLDRAELIELMVGRSVAAVFPKRDVSIGAVALELRNVSQRSAGLRSISLTVKRGEILGIAGLVGSGRTQLAETIFGLTPADSGEILLDGRPVNIASPQRAIQLGVAYLPEDRRRHGVVLEMPIAVNTSLANLGCVSRAGWIFESKQRALAQTYVGRLRIKTSSVHVPAGFLSGGNQQKVALARWLATQPAVLILDEPTQGVDVGSKAEIHGLITELAEQGLAIVMISSELPEILGMSDRIAVMCGGAISAVLSREEASQQKILALALGQAAASGSNAHASI